MTLTNTNHNLEDLKSAVEQIRTAVQSAEFDDDVKEALSSHKSRLTPYFYE
jgi:queuine/archaeosine tRNA-ribosyltransferase